MPQICSFKQVCIRLHLDPIDCTERSITEGRCQGPIIKGRGTLPLANISGGVYKIAVISQCPECGMLLGFVTLKPDTAVEENATPTPIRYRSDAVKITDELKKRIPQIVCDTCLENSRRSIATSGLANCQQTAQATA